MKIKFIFLFSIIALINVHADEVLDKAVNLGKMSYGEASNTVNDIIRQNRKLVATLVSEINQPDFPADSKLCAIYLLGELRQKDISAIQCLVDHIDFVAPRYDLRLKIGRWGQYPAQEALGKIGIASSEVILEVYLPKESNELRRKLMCEVLIQVAGNEIAQGQIKRAIDQEKDSSKKENLARASQLIDKMTIEPIK